MNIVVIGGAGGIGLGIVKGFIKRYPSANIYASFHSHVPSYSNARLSWHKLDINCELEVAAFAKSFESVDILVNAIGFLHDANKRPEKSLREFDLDFFQKNIALNTVGSIVLAKCFQPLLRAKHDTFFVTLSAKIGSISDNQMGGWLSYRASKAALNMAMKTVAIEWQRTTKNCCVLMFHPGTTDTKLSKPFQKNLPEGQLHSPEFTAIGLQHCLDTLTATDSGKFVSFNGSEIPW